MRAHVPPPDEAPHPDDLPPAQLQRRGRYRTTCTGRTLRETLLA